MPESARRTSGFRPDGYLQSRRILELGDTDFETAMFWFGGGVFSGRQTELSGRIRSVYARIAVTRVKVALSGGGWQ